VPDQTAAEEITSMTPNTSTLALGDRCVAAAFYGGPEFRGTFQGWEFGDPNSASMAFVRLDIHGGTLKAWSVRPLTAAEIDAEARDRATAYARVDL
jgi:hypothetical protein